MTDINLKTLTPDTSLPTTGFLFGADSQATASPSVYGVTTAITTILGNAASSDALVFNSDTTFSRGAIRNFRFGAADAATALAQTLSVQSVVAGTTGNVAGANFTISGSQGVGSGGGGSIIFQTAQTGTAGQTTQNSFIDVFTIGRVNTGEDRAVCFVAPSGNLVLSGSFFSGGGAGQWTLQNNGQQIAYFTSNGSTFLKYIGMSASANNVTDVILVRDAANTLALKNSTNAQEFRVYETTTGSIYKAILGNRQLIKISGASFDNGAASSAGTLTNAPAVGNPTKWIPIDDNGTTRYIPAW